MNKDEMDLVSTEELVDALRRRTTAGVLHFTRNVDAGGKTHHWMDTWGDYYTVIGLMADSLHQRQWQERRYEESDRPPVNGGDFNG